MSHLSLERYQTGYIGSLSVELMGSVLSSILLLRDNIISE
ncbi:Uncharacterised protein [Yersinia massiliensis]|nr:Uncharacterised protein [Yersinia massiliensis]